MFKCGIGLKSRENKEGPALRVPVSDRQYFWAQSKGKTMGIQALKRNQLAEIRCGHADFCVNAGVVHRAHM